jgi:hypothetical protein
MPAVQSQNGHGQERQHQLTVSSIPLKRIATTHQDIHSVVNDGAILGADKQATLATDIHSVVNDGATLQGQYLPVRLWTLKT